MGHLSESKLSATHIAFLVSFVLSSIAADCQADGPRTNSSIETPGKLAVHRRVQPIAYRSLGLTPAAGAQIATVKVIAKDPLGEVVAVAGDDHVIRILDAMTMTLLHSLEGHRDMIRTLAFDNQGKRLVSGGNDGQIILWDRQRDYRVLQRMEGGPSLYSVRFSPDGKELAIAGFQSDVMLIGKAAGAQTVKVQCDCRDLRTLAYRSDGKFLAMAGRSGELFLYDRSGSDAVAAYPLHKGRIRQLVFADQSPVVTSVGEDGQMVMFDTTTRKVVMRVPVTTGKLFSLTHLDQDHIAVAGSDDVIHIINSVVGRVVEKISGHTGSISSLTSHGDTLFSGGFDATMKRWQLSGIEVSDELVAQREKHKARLLASNE